MICPNCGQETEGRFCNHCGTKLWKEKTLDVQQSYHDMKSSEDFETIEIEDLYKEDKVIPFRAPKSGRNTGREQLVKKESMKNTADNKSEYNTIERGNAEQEKFEHRRIDLRRGDKEILDQRKYSPQNTDQKQSHQRNKDQKQSDQQKGDQKQSDQQKGDQQRTDQQKGDRQRTEQRKTERKKTEQKKADHRKTEQKKVNQIITEQKKIDQKITEQKKAELKRLKQREAEHRKYENELIDQKKLEQRRSGHSGYLRAQSPPDKPQAVTSRTAKSQTAAASSTGSFGENLGGALAKSGAGIIVVCSRVMQLLSFGLMVFLVVVMAQVFLVKGEDLGYLGSMITDHNYGLALYTGAAVFSLLMGFIWSLWILSKKSGGGELRLKKYDVGRGFLPFLLCFIAIVFAGFAISFVPKEAEAYKGMAGGATVFLTAVNERRDLLLTCCGAGLVLSLIRKLLRV